MQYPIRYPNYHTTRIIRRNGAPAASAETVRLTAADLERADLTKDDLPETAADPLALGHE